MTRRGRIIRWKMLVTMLATVTMMVIRILLPVWNHNSEPQIIPKNPFYHSGKGYKGQYRKQQSFSNQHYNNARNRNHAHPRDNNITHSHPCLFPLPNQIAGYLPIPQQQLLLLLLLIIVLRSISWAMNWKRKEVWAEEMADEEEETVAAGDEWDMRLLAERGGDIMSFLSAIVIDS